MKSLKELYRIGKGPSSSHTMGPQKAAQTFAAHNKDAKSFEVTLYGSLAATGRGHMTDVAIDEVLRPIAPLSIVWQPKVFLPYHPNGMKFVAFDAEGNRMNEWICYSVGGGALSEGEKSRWFNNKRVILYNIGGFWDSLIAMLDDLKTRGVLRAGFDDTVKVAHTLDEIAALIAQ